MCAAITRWVQYDIGQAGVAGDGGTTMIGRGMRAYTWAEVEDKDTFDIGAGNNKLYVDIGGDTDDITLTSGIGLDPRFVAKDITERLHNLAKSDPSYDQAQCVWENNALKLYSGDTGSSAVITVESGIKTAHLELGWGVPAELGGTNNNSKGSTNEYDPNGLTISGTYNGFFDEMYTVLISTTWPVNAPAKDGANAYTGTASAGGIFNNATDIEYTIAIDVSNGTTMGAGTGNVPKMSWTSTGSADDSSAAVELLYPNYWYMLGTKGAMIKFTDAVFYASDPAWVVDCDVPDYAQGSNVNAVAGVAEYVFGSTRGDDSGASTIVTSATTYTQLGTRGLSIKFTQAATNFAAGDEFRIICTPPQPAGYDISNLSYGNVTVSTEAPVKAVMFEIMSGAIEMSTVKFGLQSHGTFDHHNENDNNTYFRFGTVGPGQPAGTPPVDGREWKTDVTASDISSDTPVSGLYATQENLDVVSDADDSEVIGSSAFMGMTSDPIWVNIKLGASEVGSNSTINYRIFFDYS